ncbi:hypothetical protein ACFVWN_00955 [Nocardiopsis flavescens]|uniref:hypothetical protein n=1 Tax=Nocardiopsis flavescens TaxID=758803 RepID=UPI0036484736
MHVPPEVIEILSLPQVTTDGPLLRLPQLHPPTYRSVAAVLNAVGGHWDGAAAVRAHRFPRPAADVLADLLTGEVITDKDKEFFRTPPHVAADLLSLIPVSAGALVLEPSAGDGALVTAIADTVEEARVDMVEVDPERVPALSDLIHAGRARTLYTADFLSMVPPDPMALFDLPGSSDLYDIIAMNPPFTGQARHVLHAWEWLKPGGHLAAIVSASIRFREDRDYRQLRALIEESGAFHRDRIPTDAFAASGVPHVATVIVTLHKPQG